METESASSCSVSMFGTRNATTASVSLHLFLSKSLIIRSVAFSVELLSVIVRMCYFFKGHKWGRTCWCEMKGKWETCGEERKKKCVGTGEQRSSGDCNSENEFLQHHVNH